MRRNSRSHASRYVVMSMLVLGHSLTIFLQLNYHLYTQPRPENLAHRYFISDNIREELQRRAETMYNSPAHGLNLPEELQGYHSLLPLEATAGERRKFGNWYSTVYRATNSTDGLAYALRRVESMFDTMEHLTNTDLLRVDFRLMQQTAFTSIEAWSRINHPNIISVREAFTTRAFGDNCMLWSAFRSDIDMHICSSGCCVRLPPECADAVRGTHQAQGAAVSERSPHNAVATSSREHDLVLRHPDRACHQGRTRRGRGCAHYRCNKSARHWPE